MASNLDADCETSVRTCQWAGCSGDALYRAPRSRDCLHSYWWFCLDHVRLYNARWNYYEGMSEAEVEADIRLDVCWQRPTWRPGSARPGQRGDRPRLRDGFGLFGDDPSPPMATLSTPMTRALIVLDLRPPVTVVELKARYKRLAKQHHPDVNGGDDAAAERFRRISEAYQIVLKSLLP